MEGAISQEIEPHLLEDLVQEWEPSMEGAYSQDKKSKDILQEAMEGVEIMVGDALYDQTQHRGEHTRSTYEFENFEPCEKKSRYN